MAFKVHKKLALPTHSDAGIVSAITHFRQYFSTAALLQPLHSVDWQAKSWVVNLAAC